MGLLIRTSFEAAALIRSWSSLAFQPQSFHIAAAGMSRARHVRRHQIGEELGLYSRLQIPFWPNSNPAKYSVGPQFLHCAFFFSFLSTPSLPYNLRFLRLGMDRVSLHHLPRCYRFEPSASVHECGLPCWPPNNISSSCPTSSSGRKLLYRCSRRADKRRDEGSTPYHCSELSAGRGELGKPSSTHGSQHRASYKSVSDTRFRLLAMR